MIPKDTYSKKTCELANLCGFTNRHATIQEAEMMFSTFDSSNPRFEYAGIILGIIPEENP